MGSSIDINAVKVLVVEAGRRALPHWGRVAAQAKADQTLVTQVDRGTEEFLRAGIASLYPSHAFTGEEFGLTGSPDAPVWVCDPIDGTTNFVYGLPLWCVSLGLMENGVPVAGVVYLPVLDELFWASRGEGAFCNGAPIRARDAGIVGVEDPICLSSNGLKSINVEAVNGKLRSLGSIAIEFVYTARGNLAATVGLYEGIVDIAASWCICAEAGCSVEYLDGSTLLPGSLLPSGHTDRHFVVAAPRMMEHLREVLRPIREIER